MLKSLVVENYALIDHLEIEWDSSLNIITGETGAGKSILLGALSLLLGAKNDNATIKDSSRTCMVEGVFDLSNLALKSLFEELDLEFDTETTIRRTISPSGKSRSFINDQPVQLAELKSVGAYLIDIHSQHQNLILSSAEFRLQALDAVANNGDTLTEYGDIFRKLTMAKSRLQTLRDSARRNGEEEEWLRHQVEELRSASLRVGEREEVEQELRTLENADSVIEALGEAHHLIDDEQIGIITSLRDAENRIRKVGENYCASTELVERMHALTVELRDIERTLSYDLERIEANPEQLERLSARLDLINTLQHKHRVDSEEELLAILEQYSAKLQAIESSDEDLANAEREVATLEMEAYRLARILRDARHKASPELSSKVESILKEVGMPSAHFTIAVRECDLTSNGGDVVEFLFSANEGVTPRPIEKIASGGELSRVMLALKATLAKYLSLPTIIFDEIDTGVSGRTAFDMGDIISRLAESMQVIDITHSPQVASKGSRHLLVYKENSCTHIRPLSTDERVEEIAKMLSGDSVTEAAIQQARHLLSLLHSTPFGDNLYLLSLRAHTTRYRVYLRASLCGGLLD